MLYASYLCLSLIYCLTHVECFRFFLAANIVAAPINFRQRAQYLYYKQRLSRLCPPYCEREVWLLGHVSHVTAEITRFEASLQLACDLLSTCLQDCDQVFDQVQLARIMECGLNSIRMCRRRVIHNGRSTTHRWRCRWEHMLLQKYSKMQHTVCL